MTQWAEKRSGQRIQKGSIKESGYTISPPKSNIFLRVGFVPSEPLFRIQPVISFLCPNSILHVEISCPYRAEIWLLLSGGFTGHYHLPWMAGQPGKTELRI